MIRQANAPHPIIQDWTFGGGTAMMLRIGNRGSHDVDIFLPDPQFLSFLDPGKRDFEFEIRPDDHRGDGSRFLKLAFQGIGEIDFIVANALTPNPSTSELVSGEEVKLETVPEIIAKKIYHRRSTIKPRDIFDIASAGVLHSGEVINALKPYKNQVNEAISRMEKLNPEFVARAIAELSIDEDYAAVATTAMQELQSCCARSRLALSRLAGSRRPWRA